MKSKTRPKAKQKRNLFAEPSAGMIALAKVRQGKAKLRKHTVEKPGRRVPKAR
jgi:hypothetical protein